MLKIKRIVFTSILVVASLLTMVATTFAWVGITSNSVFDEFSIDLKVDNDKGDYGVLLSLDGNPTTFSDSIDEIELKKQILKNMGEYSNVVDGMSDEQIAMKFAQIEMGQCTPTSLTGNDLFDSNGVQEFTDFLAGIEVNRFMYFDVYVTLYEAKAGLTTSSTDYKQLFLRDSILSSDEVGTCILKNNFTYPSTTTIDGTPYNNILAGSTVRDLIKVNPASSARVCVQKFKPVDFNTLYEADSIDYRIYQYDEYMPTYDNATQVYSFGGILPAEYNMAQQQYRLSHLSEDWPDVPEWQYKRPDITYKDEGNIGRIVSEEDHFTINDKIKFRIYFWFEGWDSDCFEVIDKRRVNLNLSFSNKAPYDI